MTARAKKGGRLAAILAIGACCRSTQAGTPILNVEGGGNASGYQFSFDACRRPGVKLPIYTIGVITYAESREKSTSVCQVEASDKYGVAVAEWRYGAVPNGFRITTACQPLVSGRTYEILVFGSGVGGRRFTIGEDGTLKWLETTCK